MLDRHPSYTFIELATAEYDALHRYCNSMARISHAASIPSSHHPLGILLSQKNSSMNSIMSQVSNSSHSVDIRTLLAQQYLTERGSFTDDDSSPSSSSSTLVDAMEEYYNALESLRNCHSKLIQYISQQQEIYMMNCEHNNSLESSCVAKQPILGWMIEHGDLSSRILKTCSSSSTSKGFGPFYENGILKDLNGKDDCMNQSWHHVRIVSLASLQANITNMKRKFLEIV